MTMPSPEPQPTNLTPGMHVRPGPVTILCKRLPDGNVVIHIEHSTGATTLPIELGLAKGLIAQLQEVTGGIVVAAQA